MTVSTDREPSDHNVFDAVAVQMLQQRNRIKRVGHD